jgi:O-antigen ligase
VYRVRSRLLLFLVLIFGVAPLVLGIALGKSLVPLAICWALVFLVGAGGAGLRARGGVYETPEQDFEQRREVDRDFERPRDEGRLHG